MIVTLVGCTLAYWDNMATASDAQWEPEGNGTASDLVEFAGRACYRSWSRPNPATATNAGYLANIIGQSHFSVLEHGTVSFYIKDVSRSLTHELVRHRHFSFSQLSQRFVTLDQDHTPSRPAYITPPLYANDMYADSLLYEAWLTSVRVYNNLVEHGEAKLVKEGVDKAAARKQIREAARCVLPNMTPTALVMTGNHRAWREMLLKRGTVHADAEIRGLALELHSQLSLVEPALYADIAAVPVNHGQGSITILEQKT